MTSSSPRPPRASAVRKEERYPVRSRSGMAGIQFLRSIVCSAIGFGVDALILFLLVELAGFHYLASNAASFVSGSTVVYALSRIWAFPAPSDLKKRVQYAIFLVLAATGLLFNSLLMWALVSGLGLWYMAGKVISAIIVFIYNFACRKFIVFRERRAPAGNNRAGTPPNAPITGP